jgi:F0F1-type ATP synthase assembly protein I
LEKSKHVRAALIGYNLVLKFGVMITLPIFCSLFAGIFLDKKLGTTPWLMLLLMLIGIAFSTYAIYRVASRISEPDHTKEVQQDG